MDLKKAIEDKNVALKKAYDQGKFVEIFRRQQDGSWKVYLTIFNSDNPWPTST